MIIVNGKNVEYQEELSVDRLLEKMNFVFPMLVVKINGKLIPRDAYKKTPIEDGDKIDVVHLISGG